MQLNENQKKAIKDDSNVLIIVAGPGTGKTRVLSEKINYLIKDKSIKPSKILALTFTKRAANELKERIKNKSVITETFHSLAFDYLQSINKNLTIITNFERNETLSILSKEFKKSKRNISNYISLFKSKLSKKQDLLIDKYNKLLSDSGKIDFDDLLLYFLGTNIDLDFDYILIDEFQDTNIIQYEIIKKLKSTKTNLVVVGDPLQSIYSFRGSDSNIFETIKKDFPKVKTITLNINYRNTKEIINISKELFPVAANFVAHNKSQSIIQNILSLDNKSQSQFIVDFIISKVGGIDLMSSSNFHSEENSSFKDFAVLYRNHHLAKHISEKLTESGIPYQKIGDSIWQSKEFETLIQILKENENKNQVIFEVIKENNIDLSDELLQRINLIDQKYLKISDFLNYIEELKNKEYFDENLEFVTLSSIHSSKGLEFKNVIILDSEIKNKNNFDEEKRLMYVAVTRAKNNLIIISSQKSDLAMLVENVTPQKEDPKTAKIKEKRFKFKLKKSQQSLF